MLDDFEPEEEALKAVCMTLRPPRASTGVRLELTASRPQGFRRVPSRIT
jgi:hypothetical protein